MQYLKNILWAFMLTVLVILPGAGAQEKAKDPTAAEELSPEQFWEEFGIAFQANDAERIQQLITANPTTAKEVQQRLTRAGKGSGEEAKQYRTFAEILEQFRSGDFSFVLNRLNKEAEQADDATDYPTALEKWQIGLNQARAVNDKQYIGAFLGNIGLVYYNLGQYERALEYFEQALTIHRELSNRRGEGTALTNLGLVYAALGQYPQALEYYEQALAITREIGDRRGEGVALSNIGRVYWALGQYERALEYFEQALAIGREIGDRRREGADLTHIGSVYGNLGQYERALEYFEQALTIHRELGNRRGEGTALTNFGSVYAALGQYPQALEYYEQALAITREIGDRRGERAALGNLGHVYQNLGQYQRALEYSEQALVIDIEIGDRRSFGAALGNLGSVYMALGQHQRALGYFKQALTIRREIGDRGGEGADLTYIGSVYWNLGQYQEAYTAFQDSMSIHEALGMLDRLWRAQGGLARAKVGLNEPESAITHYDQALDTIEVLRTGLKEKEHKLSFMQDKLIMYDELIDLLQDLHKQHLDKGYDRKALEIFERKQGRLFLEEMGQSGARLFAGIPDDILQREIDLELQREQTRKQLVDERSKIIMEQNKERIKRLEDHEKTLLTEQEALQEQIKTEYPDYYALRYPKPASLAELQQDVLQPGELMLIYNVMKEKTVLWLISSNPPLPLPSTSSGQRPGGEFFRMYTLDVGEKELQEQVTELRRGMEFEYKRSRSADIYEDHESERTPSAQLSHALYTRLIPEEVRPLLTKEHRLRVVPTGPLYGLPFEALVTRESTPAPSQADSGLTGKPTPNPSQEGNVHYLIEDIPISYLSSASLLKTLREAQVRRKLIAPYPLLAFADPVYEESPSPNPSQEGTLSPNPSHQGRGTDLPSPNPSQADSGLTGNNTPAPQGGNVSLQALRSQSYSEAFQNISSMFQERGKFKRLPETAEEAREIAQLLNAPQKSDPLQLREKASRENVFAFNTNERLDDYQYVLFAMHGVLPGEVDRVTQSALVLSYPENNGYLSMADVFQLHLNAKLVSLSACNTGSGEQVRGEGVMGLTRAFMYAGTSAIAVTLWSVETFSAKELDVGMFEHLKVGQPPIHALRSIKLQMLHGEKGEDYKHPYYWAPFVVFGDAK